MEKKFYYDFSYWSHDRFTADEETGMFVKDAPDSPYASQVQVFEDLVRLVMAGCGCAG